MGPTAAGKTDLALALAAQFPFEIVSVDAAQVYRGLDIGTAKPTLEERRQVPHHLIDIREPVEIYSAADFCDDALRAMRAITAAGRIPLLAGGTMFYFRALLRGLPPLPSADPGLRAELLRDAAAHGWGALHSRLAALDPQRAARIHPNDPQRTLRALEIILLTGRMASSYGTDDHGGFPYRVVKLALYPEDRAWLHARIAQRFHDMLNKGFLDEARALFVRPDLPPDAPAARAVGYRQAGLYLSGKINYDALVDSTIAATRQLAKRQLTWLRSDSDAVRIACDGGGVLAHVRQALFATLS
jgi:tRNA dimethylallyltransferase